MSIYQILEQYWGHTAFRSLQEEIIQSVLDGNDTLALLPTGGGKSICFQVPALFKPGICIVVSPLIALMRDQVENLNERGISAVAIISGMGKREVDILLDNCIYGEIKFLYLSPERLLSDLVRERIRHMKVNLIAIDEAHCISQWGYDFRPPYLHLSELRELHPTIPVLALTATATTRVVADIQEKLQFKKGRVFRKSFERKNLSYVVFNEDNKFRKLLNITKKISGSGIIYVRNRRETQEVAKQLNLQGVSAEFYHAGLETPLRMQKQAAWKTNQVRVMVATNAFGMGIDKPDVRFVIHLDLPESLEAYYQEAGRAGRDEKKSYAVLLYNHSDKLQLEKRLEQSFPSIDQIKKIYHYLGNYFQLAYGAGEGISYPFDVADFCSRFKLDAIPTLNALRFLEHDEYLTVSETVYLPSRVKVLVGQEELYRFQIEQPAIDIFIKTLLRSYGGIFDHYISIKESDLAKRSGLSRKETIDILHKLDSAQILSYLRQTDIPQLQYVKPRVQSDDMYIDHHYIFDRLRTYTHQTKAVLGYAEKHQCRSIQLLTYFDEINVPECGVCDVCLENKRNKLKADLPETIINEIISLLTNKHLSLDVLVNAVKAGTEKDKIEALRMLIDAGKIKSDGVKYYL